MASVLLDSTVAIDVLKGRPAAVSRFLGLESAGDVPYVCAVTVEEVTSGLKPRERDRATKLFEGLRVAPLGMAEGRLAGWWRRAYREKGRTLSQADALIAAAAVGVGARLATGNPKDFPMSDLVVEHWPAGG
ncbi:MAG TPA: PIN domain-containing protein [Actinomycetota bacterium]|nr:PIN domain-containing protein [Actinomycetota bacterium]